MIWYYLTLSVSFLFLVTLAAWAMGQYIAKIYQCERAQFIEQHCFRWIGLPLAPQHWRDYLYALLWVNGIGFLLLFGILCFHSLTPFNPRGWGDFSWPIALHTAISFVTNTNLQAYTPELSVGYFAQSFGLAVQHFLSSATAVCVSLALLRGFTNESSPMIGNFYSDLFRTVVFLLLPLSFVFALFLISQGVIQNWNDYVHVTGAGSDYWLPMGPAASQTAIKMLGSNGGGFFAANGAHPFENPTLLSNYVQIASILFLPMALFFAFGRMIGKPKQAWTLYGAVTILFIINLAVMLHSEMDVPEWMDKIVAESKIPDAVTFEGKEYSNGLFGSVLWSAATTATGNGSNNAAIASHNPLSILIMIMQMHLGEVIYGGLGSGLYTLILFAIITVFVAGLMIGRSPEYLGKKIEVYEMKATMIAYLAVPLITFVGLAIAFLYPGIHGLTLNPGAAGFTEILYAYSSAAANNGSTMAGFNMTDPVIAVSLALVMAVGRFLPIIAVIAIAGNLSAKKKIAPTTATLATDSATFGFVLCAMILILGALTYFPLLAIGPINDYLVTQY